MAEIDWSKRIIVSNPLVGICHMQVCAVMDATDEEILGVCNRENPSGTTGGWSTVIRKAEDTTEFWGGEKLLPGPCADHPEERLHILVAC